MITTVENLQDVLGLDLSIAHGELAAARFRQTCKDTPGNRAAVAEARDLIDALLDMYLAGASLRG